MRETRFSTGIPRILPWKTAPIPILSLVIFATCFAFCASSAAGQEIAPKKHLVGNKAPKAYLPYASNLPLEQSSKDITRVLVSIHSSGFDALQYLDNAEAAASKVRGATKETLIVAPQFFEKKAIPGRIPDDMLFWTVSPFRGSSRGAEGPNATTVSISAYEVLDDWLRDLADREKFPQLKDIVLVGHSGGGQMVQRYAVVGKFEPPDGIQARYVVSAPSAYAYPTGVRAVPGRKLRFATPDKRKISACDNYNNWGYGLEKPYGYFKGVDPDTIRERYASRHLYYICGAKDADPKDAAISKNCGAMMQGRHRRERMQVFFAYLVHTYGDAIKRRHGIAIVPGMGHYGRGNMTSKAGLKFLFAPNPE